MIHFVTVVIPREGKVKWDYQLCPLLKHDIVNSPNENFPLIIRVDQFSFHINLYSYSIAVILWPTLKSFWIAAFCQIYENTIDMSNK